MNENDAKIIENKKLVHWTISKYFPRYVKDEDIIQCGLIGLWKAITNFNEEKSKFSTYATKCIFNEIAMFLRKESKQYRLNTCSIDEMATNSNGEEWERQLSQLETYCKEFDEIESDSILNVLEKREKTIVKLLAAGMTQSEIANMLGMTRSNVNRIIIKIRKKLREKGGITDVY